MTNFECSLNKQYVNSKNSFTSTPSPVRLTVIINTGNIKYMHLGTLVNSEGGGRWWLEPPLDPRLELVYRSLTYCEDHHSVVPYNTYIGGRTLERKASFAKTS